MAAKPDRDTQAGLRWLIEIGADEAIDKVPRDRLAASPAAAIGHRSNPPPPVAPAGLRPIGPGAESQSDLITDARARAAACETLADLARAVGEFDRCALKLTAKNTVFADGNPAAGLMLIGEAPGAEEDRKGIPFVGRAGQFLDRMLAAIGRDRTGAYITNMLFWRPPGNRNPTAEEIALCAPFVERHVVLVRPKVLVFVGAIAAKTLLDRSEGISRLRGRWFDYTAAGHDAPFQATAIFHPAYLLRRPGQKRETWRDLLAIKARLETDCSDP